MDKKSKKPGETEPDEREPEEPPFPLPRKFFSDDFEKELTEVRKRLGGTDEDWDVVDGFWKLIKR